MPLHQSSHTCPQNGIGMPGTTRFTLGAFAFFSFGALVFFWVFLSIVKSESPRWLIASAESKPYFVASAYTAEVVKPVTADPSCFSRSRLISIVALN